MPGPKNNKMTQQNYRTPSEFLDAVLRRFGIPRFDFDLACSKHDKVAPYGFEYPLVNALEQDWESELEPDWTNWINPTFNIAGTWAAKCSGSGRRILGLYPASVSTVWFREHVHERALVIFMQPRLIFLKPDGTPVTDEKGRPTPIDRDCMLISWGMGLNGYSCEDWRNW
jgi:hypothetical protein